MWVCQIPGLLRKLHCEKEVEKKHCIFVFWAGPKKVT